MKVYALWLLISFAPPGNYGGHITPVIDSYKDKADCTATLEALMAVTPRGKYACIPSNSYRKQP